MGQASDREQPCPWCELHGDGHLRHEGAERDRDPPQQEVPDPACHPARQDDPQDRRHPDAYQHVNVDKNKGTFLSSAKLNMNCILSKILMIFFHVKNDILRCELQRSQAIHDLWRPGRPCIMYLLPVHVCTGRIFGPSNIIKATYNLTLLLLYIQ